ncbi:unnamed protein product [Rotaria magnacalcarata]|uniref:Uncharacterized protein n=1 Tax=Rotaria magnacalcarata TaxID=392030 RepID=A0A814Z4A9_9BILA|nr:unnamed protein product [Rotaria magnacalcarata]CAF4679128.1 unnamed protein product [Rotaria magnacalcarata]
MVQYSARLFSTTFTWIPSIDQIDTKHLGKLRRKCLSDDDEEENQSPLRTSEHDNQIANRNQTMNKSAKLYREQYTQRDESSRTSFHSSSLFELRSLTMTTTRYLSPSLTSLTPIDHSSSVLCVPERISNSQQQGSHLIRACFEQNIHE